MERHVGDKNKEPALMQILTWPHPTLETQAKPVTEFGVELRALAESMYATMQAANGIGLAANQVGVLKRILLIEIPWQGKRYEQSGQKKDWHDKLHILINPRIITQTGKITFEEGCLSFPGLFGEVERAREITVVAQDLNGEETQLAADDLFSICIQHEIDHLNGIVFVAHMAEKRATSIKSKMLAAQSTR